jgi:hypothetical protein
MRSLRSSSGRSTGSLARPTSCGSGGRRASSATRRTSQLPPISVPRSRRPFLPPILSSFSPPPGSRQPLGRSGSGDLVRAEATRPALHRADGWHPLLHEYETRRIATLLADSQLAHRPRKADAPVARRCTPQGARFQSAEHPLEIKLKVAHLNFRHAHPQRIIHSRHAVIGLKLSMP